MARPVTALVVFFLAANLFMGLIASMGIAAMLGIGAQVGGDAATNSLNSQTNDVPTGTGTGSTLFGMYNVLGGFLSGIYDYLFPGLNMLNRAGVPVAITDRFLGDLFSLLIVIDIAAYVRGYNI